MLCLYIPRGRQISAQSWILSTWSSAGLKPKTVFSRVLLPGDKSFVSVSWLALTLILSNQNHDQWMAVWWPPPALWRWVSALHSLPGLYVSSLSQQLSTGWKGRPRGEGLCGTTWQQGLGCRGTRRGKESNLLCTVSALQSWERDFVRHGQLRFLCCP